MEPLGAAASIIAVVGLAAKVSSLCIHYSRDVKDAKRDISRIQDGVDGLKAALGEVQRLLDGLDATTLSVPHRLRDPLAACFSHLELLERKLEPGKKRRAMSCVRVRALKWPFESKEVEKIVRDLEMCIHTVLIALQVDQM
jgi:hypothetical protein